MRRVKPYLRAVKERLDNQIREELRVRLQNLFKILTGNYGSLETHELTVEHIHLCQSKKNTISKKIT